MVATSDFEGVHLLALEGGETAPVWSQAIPGLDSRFSVGVDLAPDASAIVVAGQDVIRYRRLSGDARVRHPTEILEGVTAARLGPDGVLATIDVESMVSVRGSDRSWQAPLPSDVEQKVMTVGDDGLPVLVGTTAAGEHWVLRGTADGGWDRRALRLGLRDRRRMRSRGLRVYGLMSTGGPLVAKMHSGRSVQPVPDGFTLVIGTERDTLLVGSPLAARSDGDRLEVVDLEAVRSGRHVPWLRTADLRPRRLRWEPASGELQERWAPVAASFSGERLVVALRLRTDQNLPSSTMPDPPPVRVVARPRFAAEFEELAVIDQSRWGLVRYIGLPNDTT